MTDRYLRNIEEKLHRISWLIRDYSLKVEQPEFTDIYYVKGSITFIEGSIFTFSELISVKPASYRFHLMTAKKKLICRWDSAPHHRELKTFPFHIHTPEGAFESKPLNFLQALDKITEIIFQRI